MSRQIQERTIDHSAFVEKVTLTCFDTAGETLMHPDNCWDFVFIKSARGLLALRTGMTTRAVSASHSAGDELLTISFKASAFMPLMPAERMVDEGVVLEHADPRSFWLGNAVREIPNFDNADVFVERLVKEGLVCRNPAVASIIDGDPRPMSERSLQRHFHATTGMTYKRFMMVQRAQEAVALLSTGRPASDVAFALGYSDQAHLINSLKEIMGQTPGQIQQAPVV